MNTWKEECVFVLENLGGHAYLKDIYEKFLKIHTRPVTENYRASIRDTLEKLIFDYKKSIVSKTIVNDFCDFSGQKLRDNFREKFNNICEESKPK